MATQDKTNFYIRVFYRFHGNDIDTLFDCLGKIALAYSLETLVSCYSSSLLTDKSNVGMESAIHLNISAPVVFLKFKVVAFAGQVF